MLAERALKEVKQNLCHMVNSENNEMLAIYPLMYLKNSEQFSTVI